MVMHQEAELAQLSLMASIPVDVRFAFPQSSSIPISKRTSLWSHGPGGTAYRRLLPRDIELVHGK